LLLARVDVSSIEARPLDCSVYLSGSLTLPSCICVVFRRCKVANVASSSVVKVPGGVPAEYAGVLASAATASLLLKGVSKGDVVVQSGACSLVGQAVVQLARAKGATTVSVVAPSPDEEDMVALLKSLGGDVVVPSAYPHASGGRFKALLGELPAPALAIVFEGGMGDATLAVKAKAAGASVSKLRVALDGASKADVDKLKVSLRVWSCAPPRPWLSACGSRSGWLSTLPLPSLTPVAHSLILSGCGGGVTRGQDGGGLWRGQGLVHGRL